MRSLDSIIAANRRQPKARERAADKISPANGDPLRCALMGFSAKRAVREYLADAVRPGG